MSEPIQVPMPSVAHSVLTKRGGKTEYSLDEYMALINPVYQVYEEQIRRCVSGLTSAAAQCAAARQEEQIPKLRERIVMMGGFWGVEEDTSVDPYETSERNYGRSFDEAIAEARRTGAAPPLTEQAMRDVLAGLEVHMQEMDNSGDMDDLIAECDLMARQLRAEWKIELPASHQTVLTVEGILQCPEADSLRPTRPEAAAKALPEQPAALPCSDVEFMEWFAAQCVDEMVRDIQARATPEKWDRLVAGTQQDEERQDDAPDFTTPSM